MTLIYWREHRTEFHIGLAYGVSEGAVCRTIKKVEDVLLQSKQFHLPVQPYRDRNRLAGFTVVVSNDRWLLDRICTHILAIEGDSQARLFPDNLSDYEADYKERYGKSADVPQHIKYRTLKRQPELEVTVTSQVTVTFTFTLKSSTQGCCIDYQKIIY